MKKNWVGKLQLLLSRNNLKKLNLLEIYKSFVVANKAHYKDLERQRNLSKLKGINATDLYSVIHQSSPCFVLSTGRSGTLFLTEVLQRSSQLELHHAPHPELVYYSKFAYDNQSNKELLNGIIDACRYELLRDDFLTAKISVETNNRITFFANSLGHLFPNAKFIHLVRSPESFVKSGVGRNWYLNTHHHDEGRIVPLNGMAKENWSTYSQIEKIAWLWNETNQFIENFKENQPADKVLTVVAEKMFKDSSVLEQIFNFIGVTERSNKMTIIPNKPINKGKKSTVLSANEVEQIKKITPLATLYYS